MFERITPEQAGISSKSVAEFISYLERRGVIMHSVLLMKGDKLFGEYYWKPFHRDFCHRMYSETKSYVGVAIGLLEEEGKVNLDDKFLSYFPEMIEREELGYLSELTVRELLTMQTCSYCGTWFGNPEADLFDAYINKSGMKYPSGTRWEYDSAGSEMLTRIVEKITGMSFLDYLKKKLFNEMGTFKTAEVLKTPDGYSWGGSSLLCTPRDMMSFARFVMNYGTWEGKRLMNENYLKEATKKQVSNNNGGFENSQSQGYGYQIWCTEQGGFAFNGMGCQLAICLPCKDLIFVCTADNQGNLSQKDLMFYGFFDYIANKMGKEPLQENKAGEKMLAEMTENLEIHHVSGDATSSYADKINGKTFICNQNAQKIAKFSLHFDGDKGEFRYTNAQGDKVLPFGIGKNVYGKFPQYGYSEKFAGEVTTNGHLYDCGTSAAWLSDFQLGIRCQVIDRFVGNLWMTFAFKGDAVTVSMVSNAEGFLGEYKGNFVAKIEK